MRCSGLWYGVRVNHIASAGDDSKLNMSQTFFSKLAASEKNNRLGQLGNSKNRVTIWIKGGKEKHLLPVLKYDMGREELVLDSQEHVFDKDVPVLCTFDLRGMSFFSQVIFKKSIGNFSVLHFSGDLFKSERRSSYRLMAYPLYEIWAQFDLGEKYEGSNIVDLNRRSSQTKLFHNFIKLIEGDENSELGRIKIRVQDISTTGMAIHVSDLELDYFVKDKIFQKVMIEFPDQVIEIPEVKAMYIVDYISNDKNIKRYKVGCHFPNLAPYLDDLLGSKINKLLRESDFDKDFENFIK